MIYVLKVLLIEEKLPAFHPVRVIYYGTLLHAWSDKEVVVLQSSDMFLKFLGAARFLHTQQWARVEKLKEVAETKSKGKLSLYCSRMF